MNTDRFLRRKWTLKAHDKQVVVAKGQVERPEHVLMKALIWALYLPQYDNLQIERRIGDRYKPDVVSLIPDGSPVFWGEAGAVSTKKIQSLVRRFPSTHFVISKWERSLHPYEQIVRDAVVHSNRTAPFDLIRFEERHISAHIDDHNVIHIDFDDVHWVRVEP